MHAFILEDDYLISRVIQDILTQLGFTSFSFARSEDAAVAGATEQVFDLITADARLLPGDGLKAVEAICASRRTPVVYITGYASEVQRRVPEAVVVEKPIREGALTAAVKQVMTAEKPTP